MSALQVIAGVSGMVSSGPLDINSTSDFSDSMVISKATGTGLTVTAGSTLTGTVTAGGDVGISGTLTGVAATFSGTLTASGVGGASITNNLTAGSLTTAGAMSITGAGNLDCDGAADFASTVNVVGVLSGTAATLSTTLGVTGVATFTAQSVHSGGIDVNAASDILGLTVSGGSGLSVTTNATVGGTLGVTGISTFTALSVHNGGIDVNGASDIDFLTVSGAGTGLTVTAGATLGSLDVSGASTLTGLLTLPAGFDSNAPSTVDKLTVDGTDPTSLVVNQGATIAGALGVTGIATFTAEAVFTGGLHATSGNVETSQKLYSTLGSGLGLQVLADSKLEGTTQCGPHITPSALKPGSLNVTSLTSAIVNCFNGTNDTVNNAELGSLNWYGKDGGIHRKGGMIRLTATGAWSNTPENEFKAPTKMAFHLEDSAAATTMDVAILELTDSAVTANQNTVINGDLTGTGTLAITGTSTLGVVDASGLVHLTGSGTALEVDNDIDINGHSSVTTLNASLAVLMFTTLGVSNTVSCTKSTGTGLAVTSDATVGGDLTGGGPQHRVGCGYHPYGHHRGWRWYHAEGYNR
jgi:hypothetical protein